MGFSFFFYFLGIDFHRRALVRTNRDFSMEADVLPASENPKPPTLGKNTVVVGLYVYIVVHQLYTFAKNYCLLLC
jgi:hypothetical protein